MRGLLPGHVRVARPAVVLLLAGFVGGPLSALWLRNWTPFGTFHAWLGLFAAVLFATAGWLGTRLLKGQTSGDARERAARAAGLAGTPAGPAGGAGSGAPGVAVRNFPERKWWNRKALRIASWTRHPPR